MIFKSKKRKSDIFNYEHNNGKVKFVFKGASLLGIRRTHYVFLGYINTHCTRGMSAHIMNAM